MEYKNDIIKQFADYDTGGIGLDDVDEEITELKSKIQQLQKHINELQVEKEEWWDELKLTRQVKDAHWKSYKAMEAERDKYKQAIEKIRKITTPYHTTIGLIRPNEYIKMTEIAQKAIKEE